MAQMTINTTVLRIALPRVIKRIDRACDARVAEIHKHFGDRFAFDVKPTWGQRLLWLLTQENSVSLRVPPTGRYDDDDLQRFFEANATSRYRKLMNHTELVRTTRKQQAGLILAMANITSAEDMELDTEDGWLMEYIGTGTLVWDWDKLDKGKIWQL